jgi:hypothetical protein
MSNLTITGKVRTDNRGRRLALTPEVEETYYHYYRETLTHKTSAEGAGINMDTAIRYRKYGEKHIKDAHPDLSPCNHECPPDLVVLRRFFETTKRIKAENTVALVNNIKNAGRETKNWTANAWLLERTNPDEFGQKQRVEHTGANGGPITHKLLSLDRRQAILKAAQEANDTDAEEAEIIED